MHTPSWEIQWSNELSMSTPEIDDEHQQFIVLANKLNQIIFSQQKDKALVEHIMNRLLEGALAHFANEEHILAKKNYPALQQHAQTHSEIINKFKQAMKEIQSTNSRAVWVKVGLGIKNLLVDHLLNEDTKYIKHLQTK